jgi:hypothetical protein
MIPSLPPSLKRKRSTSDVGPGNFRKVRLKYTNHRLHLKYMKRATVSELYRSEENEGIPTWNQCGAGFCSGVFTQHDPYLEVVDEDNENRKLLRHRILSHDYFRMEEDTHLYLKGVDGRDMVLSFEVAEDCKEIWRFISKYRGWARDSLFGH